jgi:hypothetical protein
MYLDKKRGIVVLIVFVLVVLSLGILLLDNNGLTGASIGILPLTNEMDSNLSNNTLELIKEVNFTNISENDYIEPDQLAINDNELSIQAVPCGDDSQPCSCTYTVTGDYTMTSNLSCTGLGLYLSSNSTLDCDNNYIIYTGSGNSYSKGIISDTSAGYNNITIKNCNLFNFSVGINLNYVNNSYLINNTLYGKSQSAALSGYNNNPAILLDCNNITFMNNSIIGNEVPGIKLTWGSNHYIDTTNTIDGLPIYYNYSIENKHFNNSELNESYSQFICDHCSNITLENLNVPYYGIHLLYTNNSLLNNLTSNSSKAYNVYLDYSSNNILNNSYFGKSNLSNLSYGFNANTFSLNNSLFNNIFNSTSVSFNSYCDNNTFENNSILNNNYIERDYSSYDFMVSDGDGLIISYSSNGNIINNNQFINNTIGVSVGSENNTFNNNTCNNNYNCIRTEYLYNNFTNMNIFNNSIGFYLPTLWGVNDFKSYVIDSTFENNSLDLLLVDNYFYSINSSVNKSKITVTSSSGKAYLKWYVDFNITDNNNNPISNSSILTYNSLNVLDTSGMTVDGIVRSSVTEMYRSENTNYYLTPSTVTASKDNYTTNSTTVNLYNKTYAQVNLTLTEVTCGANLTADFGMGNNYTCTGNGLNITSDNVVINGKGYALIGDGDGIGIDVNGKNNIQIYNLTITNFSRAINFVNSNNSNFTLITIYNNTYGIVYNISNNNSVYGSNLYNNSHSSVYTINNGGTNNSLINTTINISEVNVSGTANIFLKWYVDVNATFNGGYALSNADTYGYYNHSGLLDGSATTDSNGNGRLILSELKKNVSGITYLTPHNITLSYTPGDEEFINFTYINLTETNNTKVNLSITMNCTVPYGGITINQSTTFCSGSYELSNASTYFINITNSNLTLTCDNTRLYPSGEDSVSGYSGIINITNLENITLEGCTFEDNPLVVTYMYPINSYLSNNLNIINCTFNVSNPYSAIRTVYTNNVSIINSTFNGNGIYLIRSYNFSIEKNIFDLSSTSTGIILEGMVDGLIKNNTFLDGWNGIDFDDDNGLQYAGYPNSFFPKQSSSNIGIYHNNFSSITYYTIACSECTSDAYFNTSILNYPQGNAYSDYCDKGSDENSDGYADNSSISSEWPYSSNISTHVTDNIIDYGPFIQDCPADEIFLGSSSGGGGSSSSSSGGGEAPDTTPKSSTKTTPTTSEYTASEASKFLKVDTQTKDNDDNLEVKFTLENTGTKTMRLFPEIFQDIEDPFFIVTRKTLGYEGSFLENFAGMFYSKENVNIEEGLLKAEIEKPEHIILAPGQKLEKTLIIKEGLIPREFKIKFTTIGGVVKEQEVKSEKKALSGTAVDVTSDKNSFDLYAVVVSEELTGQLEIDHAKQIKDIDEKQAQNLLTARTVADITPIDNEYMLELNIIKKEDSFMRQSSFSDLYGPYKLKKAQNFIFAQQFKYNPEYYYGDYILKTRIYKSDKTLVENEFEINLGLQTVK